MKFTCLAGAALFAVTLCSAAGLSFPAVADSLPPAPTPAFPNDTVRTRRPSLWVQPVPGADNYHFQLFEDSVLVSECWSASNGGTVSRDLFHGHTYNWTCCVHNADGWGPFFSPNWFFPVVLYEPGDGETLHTLTPTLYGENAPGVDLWHFAVYSSDTLLAEGFPATYSWTVGSGILLDQHTYNWAYQTHTQSGWSPWSSYHTFIIWGVGIEQPEERPGVRQVRLEVAPNPVARVATIRYSLPEASDVRLKVYDLNGRLVRTLVDGRQATGEHRSSCDLSGLAKGIYLCRLTAGEFTETRTLIKQE